MNMVIPSAVQKALTVLYDNGFEGYLVGGCVRDALMGVAPHDFDLTTNALPEETLQCFSSYRTIETGIQHGTVTVVIEQNNIEITTYRIDGEYKDNRHPEQVIFTRRIEEDLSRRDFTVNAMAYSPKDGLVDVFGGVTDLKNKCICCVGEPDQRFCEDGLRIVRAMRFSATLGFLIDDNTSDSIHRNKNLLKNISAERIYSELCKLICGVNASTILTEYYDVLCVIFKELEEHKSRYCKNAGQLKNIPDAITAFAVLLDFTGDGQIGDSFSRKLLERLKPDNYTKSNVVQLIAFSNYMLSCDKFFIRRLMNKLCEENIYRLIAVKQAQTGDNLCDFIAAYEKEKAKNPCISVKQLQIKGTDLIQLGVPNGPAIGKLLNALLNQVIEDRLINDADALKAAVKSMNR